MLYVGSLRGQEGRACERAGIAFEGLRSEPLYSLRTPRGWRSAWRLLAARGGAGRILRAFKPHAVFSTGGYASSPVVAAARGAKVPYVLHEANTVPGRVNRMYASGAKAVATVFRTGGENFKGARVVRTGMPIRRELRLGAQGSFGFAQTLPADRHIILAMGGSQGAAALNDVVLATATRAAGKTLQWLHVTGPAHFERTLDGARKLAVTSHYEVRAFLEAEEMAAALFGCVMAVSRAGGSLAELAAFRKPSVLVPLPSAMGDHQRKNAEEFEAMGAASVIPQRELTPAVLERELGTWICEPEQRARASAALANWDIEDASQRIINLIEENKPS